MSSEGLAVSRPSLCPQKGPREQEPGPMGTVLWSISGAYMTPATHMQPPGPWSLWKRFSLWMGFFNLKSSISSVLKEAFARDFDTRFWFEARALEDEKEKLNDLMCLIRLKFAFGFCRNPAVWCELGHGIKLPWG